MIRSNRFRLDLRTISTLAVLIGAGSLFVTTLTSDAPETFAEEKPEPQTQAPKRGGCLTDEASVSDAQELKKELVKREAELKRRESEIAAKESALSDELKKIDSIRDEIKQSQIVIDSKNEEKVAKLVETFETMSPKAAASIVASVDERLAVEAMARLSSAKLGKILAAMDPAKAAPLTERLAGVVRAKMRTTASIGAAETTNRVKGGEENGNLKQSNTDAVSSRQPEPALGREPASSEKR